MAGTVFAVPVGIAKKHGGKGCVTKVTAPLLVRIVKVTALLLSLMFALFAAGAAGAAGRGEVRGLWVVRTSLATPDDVKAVVQFADSLRFNVLFVQVRGRGDAWYRSALVPGPENYPDIPFRFDPLDAVIRLAHARGIEVHAWLNVNPVWSSRSPPASPRHVANMHPDWFMKSRSGLDTATCPIDSVVNSAMEGRYLSPGTEQVREHLKHVVRELVRNYDVDGIHLDYLRYPGWGYDFRDEICRGFRKRYGADPRDAAAGVRPGTDPALSILDRWVAYRAGLMSALVGDISREVRRIDRRVRVSAAVKPDPAEALYAFGQDWPAWLREGTVDFVVTMSYLSEVNGYVEALHGALNMADPRHVLAGIGVHIASPAAVEEQIARAREAGLLGFCVFSYGACREGSSRTDALHHAIGDRKAELPPEFPASPRRRSR